MSGRPLRTSISVSHTCMIHLIKVSVFFYEAQIFTIILLKFQWQVIHQNIIMASLPVHKISVLTTSPSSEGSGECVQMTGISVKFHWIYGHYASTQDFSAYHISKQQRLRWVCSNDRNFRGHWNFSVNIWPLCLWIHKISVLTTSVSSKGSDECVQMTGISVGTGISVKVKFHWIYDFFASTQDFSAYHISKQRRLRWVCANDWNFSESVIPLNIWLLRQYTRFQCLSHKQEAKAQVSVCKWLEFQWALEFQWNFIEYNYGLFALTHDFSAYHISKQQRLRWMCKWLEFQWVLEFQWNSTEYMATLPIHKISVLITPASSKGSGEYVQMTGILVGTAISEKVKFHWIYGFFASTQDFSLTT